MSTTVLCQADIKAAIKHAILNNERAVYKALEVLYKRQTAEEQRCEATIADNGVGFNGRDAQFCTSLYNSYQRYHSFTCKQLICLRRILCKYTRQLMENAIDNGVYLKQGNRYVRATP